MALKLKYTDEHGIVHIDVGDDLSDPKFDSINSRFGQYDIFGGKYEPNETPSLFRSRYNSIEEELANTPYAFATERSLRVNANQVDITVASPSKDIEDDRFFNRRLSDDLFGPQLENPAFTVTHLIHAQDRYFDLSKRTGKSASDNVDKDDSFTVISASRSEGAQTDPPGAPGVTVPVVPKVKKKEKSFAILAETAISRPSSPRSLPVDIRTGRISPFKGRGFREETSRHNTPRTSAANSRASSPPRRRTYSLSRIDKMATATLPPPITLLRPASPRNFLKENIEEVRELSEMNREKHEAQADKERKVEEETLLREMRIMDKNANIDDVRNLIGSRPNSRSTSPNKISLRSRSNSPSITLNKSREYINQDDEMSHQVAHRSRVRSMSKSQPQSNDGSPKHSKIPKRQSSVSPSRNGKIPRKPQDSNMNRSPRFMSNSTSSIHDTIKIGSQIHDKRASKSTQYLSISPGHIRNKPPISPGRGGPPPANKTINSKRLSPIVGTPNKVIVELKPKSAKPTTKPSTTKRPIKTAGNTPAASRLNSRQPSRAASRETSPDKRKTAIQTSKTASSKQVNGTSKPISRVPSTKNLQKPPIPKTEPKRSMSRTDSMKNLARAPSTKNLSDKPPLKKKDSKSSLMDKSQSTAKLNEIGAKKGSAKSVKNAQGKTAQNDTKTFVDSSTDVEEVPKQDNQTQYDKDKIVNEKGDIVLLTKKSVISMTTAAITAQPLEVLTTVSNQLPAAFEKAKEKGIFEKHNSKDSLLGKDDDKVKETAKIETIKEKTEEKVPPKPARSNYDKPIFTEDNVKLKPLQPPYNNPQVERVKQKIDDILKEPEVSRENILTASATSREAKSSFKSLADKNKSAKDEAAMKLTDLKEQLKKQSEKETKERDKSTSKIRSEATKIVDSIITPVEEPKPEQSKTGEPKKDIDPIVVVVNEKQKNRELEVDKLEKMNETLVKGDAEVEVQSSNFSTPGVERLTLEKNLKAEKKMESDGSDKSAHSNGGYPGQSTLLRFPQSTSTTPKPPPRKSKDLSPTDHEVKPEDQNAKRPNICQRLMGKCKTKCCPCCIKGEAETDMEEGKKKEDIEVKVEEKEMKQGMMSKFSWCKKKDKVEEEIHKEAEMAAGKAATIEFEDETKRKRQLRDIFCGCCGRRRRVSDVSAMTPRNVADVTMTPGVPVVETGCCGKPKVVERRDSILSDRQPAGCCGRMSTWMRGMCRRRSEHSSSRRTSMFSKNKSLSPTLPPEDTRKKLDTSLIEHTSLIRGAIPVLPIALAFWCLLCNIVIPGLGTIFSGMFCLCFGIPRFGVHDGAKYRVGSFVINLLVGCGQLFTVLFCLVGWGWSIWWGVIMVRTSRKYRKLKAEAAAAEVEAAPPVTANNHTRA